MWKKNQPHLSIAVAAPPFPGIHSVVAPQRVPQNLRGEAGGGWVMPGGKAMPRGRMAWHSTCWSRTWLCCQLGRRERPAARTSGKRGLGVPLVSLQTLACSVSMLPTKQQARSHGNVLCKEHREGSTVTCSGGTMLLLLPLHPKSPNTARPQGRSSSPAIALLEEASSVSTWIFSSTGCSLGLPKAKTRMETSHFAGKNSRQGWGFFLWFRLFPFFFFVLVFGYERKFPAMKS